MILPDPGLPDMDGIEVIKEVRSWSNMSIIVVSARADGRETQEPLRAYSLVPMPAQRYARSGRLMMAEKKHPVCFTRTISVKHTGCLLFAKF